MSQLTEVNINVVEQKAPTIESVKLYKEMMEEAVKSVVALVQVSNNLIDFTVAKIERLDSIVGYYQCHLVVNGKNIDFKVDFPSRANKNSTEEVYRLLLDALSKELFELIMPQIMKELR